MLLKIYSLLVWLAIAITLSQCKITVRDGRLIDSNGGERIYHGLNLVAKQPPYITHFNETDMKKFQEWGINGIRLGVMWPGVQPAKGQFNQTYLQKMYETVQLASKYGIHTLVQFHQDLFSEKFCADGVPVWAIPRQLYHGFPRPLSMKTYQFDNVTGKPRWQDCSKHPWGQYYISDAVSKSFGSLWKNKYGLRDMFVKYWRKVASTFKSSQNVIAYQIMNEPWPGNPFQNPLVMVPGLSELIHLQPAYDIISNAIREVDPHHSICFEPVTWLNYFRAGFTHAPGGRRYQNSSIFCYHYYNPPTFNLQKFMKARMKDVKRLGTGGLLSQFYVINAEGEKNIQMLNQCDDNLQSWFGWIYDIKSNAPRQYQSQNGLSDVLSYQGGVSKLIEGITRTYAPRVAGQTIHQKFDPVTRKFTLSYYICNKCGDSIIFVSREVVYPKGYSIDCYPKESVQCQEDGEFYINVRGINLREKSEVLVVISAL